MKGLTQYEVMNIENRMIVDSEWPEEPEDDEWKEEEVFEDDDVDEF